MKKLYSFYIFCRRRRKERITLNKLSLKKADVHVCRYVWVFRKKTCQFLCATGANCIRHNFFFLVLLPCCPAFLIIHVIFTWSEDICKNCLVCIQCVVVLRIWQYVNQHTIFMSSHKNLVRSGYCQVLSSTRLHFI